MESLLEIIQEIVPCISLIAVASIIHSICKYGPKSFEISYRKFKLKFKK